MYISERISEVGEYFKEMQIKTVDNVPVVYVVVDFPYGWIIDDTVEEKYNVTIVKQNGSYVFACDAIDGENCVFDAISYCITKMKNAIERSKLLKEKVSELKDLFSDETIPIKSLRELKFSYNQLDVLDTQTNNKQCKDIDYSCETIEKNDSNNKKKEEKIKETNE